MRDGLGRLGRVVLLGGTSEIGLAVVDRLTRRRRVREVVLAGRDETGLERAAATRRGDGTRVSVRSLDARDSSNAIDDDVAEAVGAGTDVVIHAIGMLPHDDRDGRDPDLAAEVFDVTTTGSGLMLLAAARALAGQGHGTLVALSSVAAVRARPDNLVYGAAKAGYDALACGLADQLRGSGARVLVVRPGFVHSRMTAGHPPAPLARTPDDVARRVDRALDRPDHMLSRRIVWVPPTVGVVAVGIRLLPGPVLAAAARALHRTGPSQVDPGPDHPGDEAGPAADPT